MITLKLIVRNAFRHRLRTLLTVLAIAISVLAFSILRTMVCAWYSGADLSSPSRLVTRNAVSLGFSLPVSYKKQISLIKGVRLVSYANWFGGIYINERNFFANWAVDPERYFEFHPEYLLPPDQYAAFLRERKACIVGRKLCDKYGWKVGDTIILKGTVFPGDWEFVLRGIYRGRDKTTDEKQFFFHWDYRYEKLKSTLPHRASQVGLFLIGLTDPGLAAEVSSEIDRTFRNSPAETITETEKVFQMNFVNMTGNAIVLIQLVSFVVLMIMATVIANTMAMSVRERKAEYAVLKTIGFGGAHIMLLVLGESLCMSLTGYALGVALSFPAVSLIADTLGVYFPLFSMNSQTLAVAFVATCLVGLVSPLFPAYRAVAGTVADGLRDIAQG
jgi:putative ABC transport system permease protein